MAPIDAPCRRDFTAVHSGGSRSLSRITLVVMHDEEASSARAAAAWFANPASAGSAHICVDDQECYRTLENRMIPWGAPGANTQGFHIEQAGFARWSAVIWRRHLSTLRHAAFKAALHCHYFHIPVRFVKAAGLVAGEHGITTHAEVTKAFGGTHTDPGPLWPRAIFMALTRRYFKQLGKERV